MKIVVVGGVAGGMSFAARARRLAEDAQIVVLERDPYVSYANCGLPYHLGGEIGDRDALLLHTPQSLAKSLALDVRTGHEVLAIDPAGRTVAVRDRATGRDYHESYDVLVLSTGAAPVIPPVPGAGLPAVRVLRTVPDVDVLRELVDGGARRAVIVGAGFIGLEAAEALRHRGLAVTLVELAGQVMPALDPEMARSIERELLRAGVEVRLGTSVTALRDAGGGTVTASLSDGSQVPADLVLLAAGVRPETSLAAAAGLALGARGALLVDEHLRTSVPSIYGVGDAIEVTDAVTGGPALVPLAGPASRQGRAAADHLFGRGGRRSPVLGTAIVRVFGTVAAATGPAEKALRAAGIPHHAVHLHPNNHAGYYPGARPLHLKLLFAPDGRVLGAQATGGDGVDKRIDVIATAIRAGLTVDDLAGLRTRLLATVRVSQRPGQPGRHGRQQPAHRQPGPMAGQRPAPPRPPGGAAGRPLSCRVPPRPPARRAEHPAHRTAPAARRDPPGPPPAGVLRVRLPVLPRAPPATAKRLARRPLPVRRPVHTAAGTPRPGPRTGRTGGRTDTDLPVRPWGVPELVQTI